MSDKYEIIAQNCLALAIDRCETAGLPLKVKRQRMVIKGAIRQMLEEERVVEKLEAARLLESLTPGGSEFSSSPEACAAWVRERLSSTGRLAKERNALREQGEALAIELDRANRLLTQFSVLAYKAEIQDHIPFGLADEVRDWVKDNGADIALRQWQEATE